MTITMAMAEDVGGGGTRTDVRALHQGSSSPSAEY